MSAPAWFRRGPVARALFATAVILAAGPLVSCSDRSPAATPDGRVRDVEGPSTLERYASGELTFGDPAAAGYAPVAEPDLRDQGKAAPVTRPVLRTPDQVLSGMGTVRVQAGRETLAGAVPIDRVPPAGSLPNTRDGNRRNDLGELMVLDDAASLACGDAEIALRQFDAGRADSAAEQLRKASGQAQRSTTVGVSAWSSPLAAVQPDGSDVTAVVAFLTVCTDGGYEL